MNESNDVTDGSLEMSKKKVVRIWRNAMHGSEPDADGFDGGAFWGPFWTRFPDIRIQMIAYGAVYVDRETWRAIQEMDCFSDYSLGGTEDAFHSSISLEDWAGRSSVISLWVRNRTLDMDRSIVFSSTDPDWKEVLQLHGNCGEEVWMWNGLGEPRYEGSRIYTLHAKIISVECVR